MRTTHPLLRTFPWHLLAWLGVIVLISFSATQLTGCGARELVDGVLPSPSPTSPTHVEFGIDGNWAGESGDSAQFWGRGYGDAGALEWSFGGGASPDAPTGFDPVVTLGSPGTYTGRVWATNNGKRSADLTFTYVVGSVPIVAQVLVAAEADEYSFLPLAIGGDLGDVAELTWYADPPSAAEFEAPTLMTTTVRLAGVPADTPITIGALVTRKDGRKGRTETTLQVHDTVTTAPNLWELDFHAATLEGVEGETYTFSFAHAVPAIQSGDLIVGSLEGGHGYLMRVSHVETQLQRLILEATPVDLTQALVSGTVEATIQLADREGTADEATRWAAGPVWDGEPPSYFVSGLSAWHSEDLDISFPVVDFQGGTTRVDVEGVYNGAELQSLRFTVDGDFSARVEAFIEARAAAGIGATLFETSHTMLAFFFLGPFPTALLFNFEISADVAVGWDATMRTGFEWNCSLNELGVLVDGSGNQQPLGTVTGSFTPQPTSVDVRGTGSADLYPHFQLSLVTLTWPAPLLIGPYVTVGPYVGAEITNTPPDPCFPWHVEVGGRGEFGVEASILGLVGGSDVLALWEEPLEPNPLVQGLYCPDCTFPPDVIRIEPAAPEGTENTELLLTAPASNNATSWTWDFAGAAIIIEQMGESARVQLGTPGSYPCTVVASNACGDSEPFPFTLTVQPGPTDCLSPAWGSAHHSDWPIDAGQYLSLTDHNGEVWASFLGGPHLQVARFLPGPGGGSWTMHTADSSASCGYYSELLSTGEGDALLAAYLTNAPSLRVRVSRTPTPQSEGDWFPPVTLPVGEILGYQISGTTIDGRPALAFTPQASGVTHLGFAWANDPIPRLSENWETYIAYSQANQSGMRPSLSAHAGVWWIGFSRLLSGNPTQFCMTRSTTSTPHGQGDWSIPYVIDTGSEFGRTSMVTYQGRLIASHPGINEADVRICASTTPLPSSALDWCAYEMFAGAGASSLAVDGERLLLMRSNAFDGYHLDVYRTCEASPCGRSAWEPDVPRLATSQVEHFSDLAVGASGPVIGFRNLNYQQLGWIAVE